MHSKRESEREREKERGREIMKGENINLSFVSQ
jgi:hypothetical protein